MGKIICEICKKECNSLQSLSNHLYRQHPGITSQIYYDSYLSIDKFCPFCGEPRQFINLVKGLKPTCGKKACSDKIKKEKTQKTCLEKYGVSNPMKVESTKEKMKKNQLEKTGYEWALQNPDVIKKRGETNLKERGVRNVFQDEEIKTKSRETRKETYGVDVSSPTLIPEIREKQVQTTLKNHNVGSFLEKEEIREMGYKAQEDKYGARHFLQSETFNRKRSEYLLKQYETNKKRYGGIQPSCDPQVMDKNYETRKQKGTSKSSKEEKQILSELRKRCSSVDSPYKEPRYPFQCDFYIKDDDLFIEYNGYWHHNGHFYNEENIEDQKKLEIWKKKKGISKRNQYDIAIKVWTESDPLKHRTAVENRLNYLVLWNKKDADRFLKDDLEFCYTQEACLEELRLIKEKPAFYEDGGSFNRIVISYQKHFYEKEKQLWKESLGLRTRLLNNRLKYMERKGVEISNITDQELLRGFKTSRIYFGFSFHSPFWIKKFIEDFNIQSIYDPCGGWGHRMLGSGSIPYIYNDLDPRSCESVKKMVEDFDIKNKKVYNSNCTNFTPTEDYECVFTCPPYYNIEVYNNVPFKETYEEWLNGFWFDTIKASLKKSVKFFCFIITEKFKEDMKKICLKFDFNLSFVSEHRLGTQRKSLGTNKKNWEYLVILKHF